MTSIRQEIFLRLSRSFNSIVLEIKDDSAHHQGHLESGSGQETHFSIFMVSGSFKGQNKINRERAVYRVLDDLIKTHVHAISLTLRTPAEHEMVIKV